MSSHFPYIRRVPQTLRNPLKLNNSVVNFNRRLIRNAPTFVFYYNKEKPNNRTEHFEISITTLKESSYFSTD
ncbi:protein of unknown function [Streptococcus thermophilus]|nr:protein of unknown function [Streptococcus thermophilus]CAD0125932.1 protein of unknown function [Streptococcus thermophilus]CAD0128299.1 protein of unknown function [Streptococcus thermophilus]CAD0134984.1 protein of unknown function [Streptococcus thermophilus]CAD0138574.1 protein of unknown function [Streptococcus thermophilus]